MIIRYSMLGILLFSSISYQAFAVRKGNSEIFWGTGIVTSEEFYGVTSISNMDMPKKYSGANFFSYRYFVSDWVAIGLTAGYDNVKGDLTYGYYVFDRMGTSGVTGNYIHNTVTIAPEVLLKYYGRHHFMVYGLLGVGYTISNIQKSYYPDYYIHSANYYNTYLEPTNPFSSNQNHFNAQITPIGCRIGGTVAWYLEFGFGYKGLLNTGLSVKF